MCRPYLPIYAPRRKELFTPKSQDTCTKESYLMLECARHNMQSAVRRRRRPLRVVRLPIYMTEGAHNLIIHLEDKIQKPLFDLALQPKLDIRT